MATNFATDTLKSVTSKATAPTSSVTTTDSAVAEFRDHQLQHQHAQGDAATNGTNGNMTADTTVGHSAPTLSDSAVAELKAAYVAVEKAIADAKSGSTATDTATTDSTANDTSTSDSSATDKAATGKTTDTTTHQPPADPLVKVLTDATGESTATVQGVLQQVRAVLHQEHLTDATSHTGTTDTATSTSTTTANDDAKTGTGDAPHWHDRLIAQHDGSGTTGSTDAGTGQAAADGGSAIWQHFLNHYASSDSTVTGNPDVVAAVDEFVDTVQSLHLDSGHGQMHGQTHGHGTDGVHLDTAA
ncbi:hypothetical protein GBZ48_34950 [Azospirillum melinis]|uniref:Uncharacterized protein n=1 Tax=Azospirillum melinis TaxID=328839 RepID=A0ABX2KPT8_9PROT|nr:hypothetical protein [Azospirillum melinis]MBP2308614.1 hypothetical protein [Azospirillum melinis]NUB04396.1 hypothetical protein [Azospirillum melinis]